MPKRKYIPPAMARIGESLDPDTLEAFTLVIDRHDLDDRVLLEIAVGVMALDCALLAEELQTHVPSGQNMTLLPWGEA